MGAIISTVRDTNSANEDKKGQQLLQSLGTNKEWVTDFLHFMIDLMFISKSRTHHMTFNDGYMLSFI